VADRRRSAARAIDLRARALRVLVRDVDGVLTDGRILIDARGCEARVFRASDRAAFRLLARAGLRVVGLASERPRRLPPFARALGLVAVLEGGASGLGSVQRWCRRRRLSLEHIAYVGHDVMSLPLLAAAGLAVVVRDAPMPVRAAAHWVTSRAGGAGVGAEVAERILRAQGKWASTVGETWRQWD
jgi:3-deoxy-D-manno-octulosonate 8-phosphate phosphatase (KDO 8-P phosphatase)